ncbi:MAG: hypothetical protein Q3976_02115 [Corynebacterium sp.]|nr:hypothetical protein [Corynebacterium sp.]
MIHRTARWLSKTTGILATLALATSPLTAVAAPEDYLPASLSSQIPTQYGFIDLVGQDFDEESKAVSWGLTSRPTGSGQEPYTYSERVRMVIPQQVGDITIGKPYLSDFSFIAPTSSMTRDGSANRDIEWANQYNQFLSTIKSTDDATVQQTMAQLIEDNPEWAIFLDNNSLADNSTAPSTAKTLLAGDTTTWTPIASDNPVVQLYSNGSTLLRDSDGDFVRILGGVNIAESGTIFYQKIPASFMNDFYLASAENPELAFAQYAAAVLPLTDTTIYETSIRTPLATNASLPAGSPITGDPHEIANAAFNGAFQAFNPGASPVTPPEFFYNWVVRGQVIGNDTRYDLASTETGGLSLEEFEKVLRQDTPEQADAILDTLQSIIDTMTASFADISEATDSQGNKWWIIDQTQKQSVNFTVHAPITSEINKDTATQWIPAQAFVFEACLLGEETISQDCTSTLDTPAGSGTANAVAIWALMPPIR